MIAPYFYGIQLLAYDLQQEGDLGKLPAAKVLRKSEFQLQMVMSDD